jgi:ubiquinone/menaquinone biosynthesis C-methylase UbiE
VRAADYAVSGLLTRAPQSPARQLSGVTEVHGRSREDTPVPDYLARTYWWAYMHPRSVYVFERQWLVNLILWGNFPRLRDAALDTLGQRLDGNTLQIACVYGNLTARLFARLDKNARLDVVDILPIQLENLARKLPPGCGVRHIHGNSAALDLESASYDRALLFFLLHEQPEDVRRDTLAEAFRVVRPGGQLVIVDYHRPHRVNPLYLPMMALLTALEPFALDLWRHEVARWFPAEQRVSAIEKFTTFGGLYQILKVTV